MSIHLRAIWYFIQYSTFFLIFEDKFYIYFKKLFYIPTLARQQIYWRQKKCTLIFFCLRTITVSTNQYLNPQSRRLILILGISDFSLKPQSAIRRPCTYKLKNNSALVTRCRKRQRDFVYFRVNTSVRGNVNYSAICWLALHSSRVVR